MNYPKVLVVTMGRINAADTFNNGLLLRNLFQCWPRENLAEIYSSGDNGDAGFFGRYYKLGPRDRRFGHLFYKVKTSAYESSMQRITVSTPVNSEKQNEFSLKSAAKRLLVDTGLYELIFRPRISKEMNAWIQEFNPDIIFAQGYCLTFTWLPVMLKKRFKTKMTFFTTDDWPSYLYSGQHGEIKFFMPMMRRIVKSATAKLMAAVDVPFAFGQPMSDEYAERYEREFITLSHADNVKRFTDAVPIRSHPAGTFTILAVGGFTKYRWPLMLDVNESCRLLNEEGINVRAAVLCSAIDPEGREELKKAQHIDLFDDPGNDLLPAYLKGADLLLLAESFDEGRVSAIGLSISSKSHLFMFSRKPIIVYAHPSTGVCKYAEKYRWARLVTKRNIEMLRKSIHDLLINTDEVERLVSNADEVAKKFHLNEVNQNHFLESLTNNPD
ncbi:MAG: hypothetical protein JXA06_12030 [Bacteroidetes bacterium]|nr:hypothetical protein [Bacteroidota bacterium]